MYVCYNKTSEWAATLVVERLGIEAMELVGVVTCGGGKIDATSLCKHQRSATSEWTVH